MAEPNYTLKLTLDEAMMIKALVADHKALLEREIPRLDADAPERKGREQEYMVVERLAHRL
jgi:hypothetical protein